VGEKKDAFCKSFDVHSKQNDDLIELIATVWK